MRAELFFLALLGLCAPVRATTIVEADPTGYMAYFGTGFAFTQSWTMSGTFSNVNIAPDLHSVIGTATAYLTTQIGPGTTAGADQLATTTFSSGLGFTTLFSGLTLGPGTYFLTLHTEDPGENLWNSGPLATAVITGVPGSSIGNAYVGASNGVGGSLLNPAYPPSSTFAISSVNEGNAVLGLRVTGNPVPEPSSAAFLVVGVLLIWGRDLVASGRWKRDGF